MGFWAEATRPRFSGPAVALWFMWAAFFLAYEVWAILDGRADTPPLTQVFVWYVPGWLGMAFCAWLLAHFGVRY